MKNLIRIIILTLILSSCGQTVDWDKEKEYFNPKKGILYYKGSPFTGKLVEYYENGQLEEKSNYKDCKRDGSY